MTTSAAGGGESQQPEGGEGGEAPQQQPEQAPGDAIRVCVRFRPLTANEVAKHESEVWGKVDDTTVGVVGRFSVTAKYAFDKVYGPEATNDEVYQHMVADLVESVPDGFCNTVFAYGVTSSGKTHTMHGTDSQAGMVTRALQQLFASVSADPSRDYLLRVSYVEIYNEIINDLLDPARTNLRVVEDPVRGQVVEGVREFPILSAEEAVGLVARGEAHRKVSATAANEGSSRSHTLVRISVESASAAAEGGSPTRRLSALNLIDLAGSEAAKVQQSKEQSREGSYINRSLLALGTVIAKLGDRNASHIPFRDSKLTRLLASSLSGRGARVCVVCTATPTAVQAEETHNTLKFAVRAKAVRVKATRHERSNANELLMRYQQEVADLRQQLGRLQQAHGPQHHPAGMPPLHQHQHQHQHQLAPHMDGAVDLEALQEVLALREQLEEERAVRVMYERERGELQARVARLTRLAMGSDGGGVPEMVDVEVWRAEQSLGLTQPEPQDAGAADDYHNVIMGMREQMLTLQDELYERDRQIGELRLHGESILANASQIRLEAERERDASSSAAAELHCNDGGFAGVGGVEDGYRALEAQLQAAVEENERLHNARANEDETLRRVQGMEEQVQVMVRELDSKERQLEAERSTLRQFQELEKQVEVQLNETSQENATLRLELERLEANNNHLQGYLLDSMSGSQLSHLVRTLTQAVERVRVTVQMRRLAAPSPPEASSPRSAGAPATPGSAQQPQLGEAWAHGSRASAVMPMPAGDSPVSLDSQNRLPDGQQLDVLHKAMPLRRPKPYQYSRTPDNGTPRSSASSSGPSSGFRLGAFS